MAAPLSALAQDSKGTDFWLGFPDNLGGPSGLFLFLAGDTATSGQVAIDGLGFSAPFDVTPGTVTSVSLPLEASMPLYDTVQDLGIHVTSADEVTIYGLSRASATTDAYLGLPTDVLGTEYIVLGYENVNIVNQTEFAIVASQDGTTVTITPSDQADSHPAGTPFDVALNQGQTFQLSNRVDGGDLTGTTIVSDKPIAVYGGHYCANIPRGFVACDHIVEQLPPTSAWGRQFVTLPLATRTKGDTFRILASTDGTDVSINGTVVATLNRGEFHEEIVTDPAVINASGPVLVSQYSNSSSFDGVTSDPFMMLIPPYEQFLPNYTVTTPESGFNINFINIVAPDAAVGSVEVDGTAIPAGDFTAIGSSGFSGAQVEVALGSHTLNSPLPFGAFMYGYASFDSYGYPGGMSLSPVAIVSNLVLSPNTATRSVGTELCLTADVTDQDDNPLEGIRVDFEVTGVNPGTGFDNTNENGAAVFCYTGNNEGEDTVEASVGSLSDTSTITWTVGGGGGGKVKGSGSGAFGPFGLLFAALGVWWSRRLQSRRRGVEALALLCATVLVGAGLAPAPATAAGTGFYVGGSIGQADGDYSAGDLTKSLNKKGYTVSDVSVDDSDTGWKLFAGYRFHPNFAVEAAYVDLGEMTSEMTTTAADMQAFVDDVADVHRFMTNSFGVSAVGILPVGEQFELFGKLGVHFWEAEAKAHVVGGGPKAKIDEDGTDMTWGVGAQYAFNETWGVRLEYEGFEADSDWLNLLSVGVVAKF